MHGKFKVTTAESWYDLNAEFAANYKLNVPFANYL